MDATRDMTTATPSDGAVFQALLAVGNALGRRYAYWHAGVYHFVLAENWTLALSAESADRFRIDACFRGTPRATFWSLASDRERLASIVVQAEAEVQGRIAA